MSQNLHQFPAGAATGGRGVGAPRDFHRSAQPRRAYRVVGSPGRGHLDHRCDLFPRWYRAGGRRLGCRLCVSVSNKGLAAPPGLSSVTVSQQAWDAIEASGEPRAWLFDLRTHRRHESDWAHWHPYPTTMPTGLLTALNVSLTLILEEGLERRISRTRAAALRVRQGLRDLGFSMLCADEHASPITTAAMARQDLPVGELVAALRDRYRDLHFRRDRRSCWQDLPNQSHRPLDRASGNGSVADRVR